jgi:hypothetical protein
LSLRISGAQKKARGTEGEGVMMSDSSCSIEIKAKSRGWLVAGIVASAVWLVLKKGGGWLPSLVIINWTFRLVTSIPELPYRLMLKRMGVKLEVKRWVTILNWKILLHVAFTVAIFDLHLRYSGFLSGQLLTFIYLTMPRSTYYAVLFSFFYSQSIFSVSALLLSNLEHELS